MSDALFRDPFEAVPDAIVVAGEDGRVVHVNGQTVRLFGYARDELVGRPIDMLLPELPAGGRLGVRAADLKEPTVRPMGVEADVRGRRKDGTEFHAEVSFASLRTGDEVLVTAAIRDVTKQKRAEGRFRAFIEAAPDAIVIVGPHGNIVLVNAQTERMFGHAREQVLGRNVEMLVPARLRGAGLQSRSGFFGAPGADVRAWGSGVELVGLRADGSEFPVEISFSPIETDEGTLVSSALRDITHRGQTETALKVANAELEAFSYSVAHDLRAPLRAMSGFSQVLLDTYKDKIDAEGQDWLEEIAFNSKKMGALIDALLGLSRLTRAEMRPEPVDLSAIAQSIAARLARGEPDRHVDVVVEEHLRAEADPVLMRALFENLVGNAWKFTRDAASARIEVGAAADPSGAIAFFVRDNGAGLDMTFADKLFTPFQRLHTTDEFPGMGIGLATAQRIVHRHGGRIWAESRVGEGAVFRFTLPRPRPPAGGS